MDFYNMMQKNTFHNVDSIESFLDTPIYKFIRQEFVRQAIVSKRFRFNNVKSWDDPYELYFFKQNVKIDGIPFKELNEEINLICGQCWTTEKDSDAFWRIYNGGYVRVRTSARKILSLIISHRQKISASARCGFVKYMPQRNIEYEFQKIEDAGILINKIFESLFWKREEFYYENEVRFLLYQSGDENLYKENFKDFIELEFNPFDFFDEITFAPNLSKAEYEKEKKEWERITGPIALTMSNLYSFNRIDKDLTFRTKMKMELTSDKLTSIYFE